MIPHMLRLVAFVAVANAQPTMEIKGWTPTGELVANADVGASWAVDASDAWAVRRIVIPIVIPRSVPGEKLPLTARVLHTPAHAAELVNLLVPAIGASDAMRAALLDLLPRSTRPQDTEPSCAYVRPRDDTSVVITDCAREQVVRFTGSGACDLTAYIARDGSLAWGGSCETVPARPTSSLTPPADTRYLGRVAVSARCVAADGTPMEEPPSLVSFGWRCSPRVADVFAASRPTDVVPGWRYQ